MVLEALDLTEAVELLARPAPPLAVAQRVALEEGVVGALSLERRLRYLQERLLALLLQVVAVPVRERPGGQATDNNQSVSFVCLFLFL